MKKESYIKKAYDLGFKYEKDYHGCAQSTIAAVQDSLGIRNDFVFKVTSGLAGGCGGIGDGMCGGYSGGSIVMCTFFGRRRDKFDNDNEDKECCNQMVRLLHDKFIEQYGSIICREIQAEMIANGRPSAAKLRNAMSNPHTWNALKQIGLIPKQTKILEGNVNPQLKIELKGVEDEDI